MRARKQVLLLGLLASLCCCGREVGWVEGEKIYEAHDGPVRLELVRKVEWNRGRLPGPMTTFWVRVHTDPPFDEYVEFCSQVDMAGDETGKFVAYRCPAEEQTWTVLRLFGGERRIRECNVADTNDQLDFAALGGTLDGLERALSCPGFVRGNLEENLIELVQTVEQAEGGDAVVSLLAAIVERELVDESRLFHGWDPVIEALSEPVRPRARQALSR